MKIIKKIKLSQNILRAVTLVKTPWQRIQVAYAGPLFNYLLTFFILIIMALTFGLNTRTNKGVLVADIMPKSSASTSKLQINDTIIGINDQKVTNLLEYSNLMQPFLKSDMKPNINLTIRRVSDETDPLLLNILLQPQKVDGRWQFGLKLSDVMVKRRFGLIAAVQKSFMTCVNNTVLYVKLIGSMFTQGVGKNLMGPLGIAQASGKIKIYDIEKVLSFIAAISLSLGFFNLLPIPPLDGGNAVVFFSEMIVGPNISQKIHEILAMLGLVLIGLLMLWTLGQDIIRLVF